MRAFLISLLHVIPWLIALYFLLSSFGVFAFTEFTPTMLISNRIIADQGIYLQKNLKYQQILPTKTPDFTYRVDEYVTGLGETGYVIYYIYPDNTVTTFGVGPDTMFRHYSGYVNDTKL